MKNRHITLIFLTHCVACIIGFGAGIYALPIIIAPVSPTDTEILSLSSKAQYKGVFSKDLEGSDALHWGEGNVSLNSTSITLIGKLAPGPDYKLYLSPEFIETEADFLRVKESMVQVGDVKTFNNFIVALPSEVTLNNYNSIIIWCESFGQFITSAKYQ